MLKDKLLAATLMPQCNYMTSGVHKHLWISTSIKPLININMNEIAQAVLNVHCSNHN
jgi:hypothetical protein